MRFDQPYTEETEGERILYWSIINFMSATISESVAKVLVINEKREALILTTGEYKTAPHKSYKPDLPGGLVDLGETELDAVARELSEEAGINSNMRTFKLAYSKTSFYSDELKSVSKFLYLLFLDNTPEVTLSSEHSSFSGTTLRGLTDTVEFRTFYKEAIDYCFSSELYLVI